MRSSLNYVFGFLALSCLGLWFMPSNTALAQTPKIAVVDLNLAMNEVEEGKSAIAQLEKRFNVTKGGLEKKGQEIQQMQADLERKSELMNEDVKKARVQEIQDKMLAFQKAEYEANQEMQSLRNQLQMELAEQLKEVCKELAKTEGYTLVLEKSVVWYSPDSYDITEKLIAAFNKKGGSQ